MYFISVPLGDSCEVDGVDKWCVESVECNDTHICECPVDTTWSQELDVCVHENCKKCSKLCY